MRGVSLGVAVLCVIAAGAPVNAAAQGDRTAARPVDRILAIVGSKPILASQVEEQLVLAQAQGLKVPSDSAGREAARRQILTQMVEEELLVQKGKLRPIPPTEVQMGEFWQQNSAQQPKRPASISFRQIVIVSQPDSVGKARARQLAESLVVALRHGANFADVAKKFSADTASREQGGDLGWFRRGQMVKEFEDVAFRLRPGEISPPVESPFGYHIIRVERVQPAEVLARHVLVAPEISPAQIDSARRRAALVHDALAASASFDSPAP